RITIRRGEPGKRIGIALVAVAVVLTLFAGRLVQIQGMEAGYYREVAKKQTFEAIPLPAMRGTIYGADGQVLAMTVETYTVTADPPQIADKPHAAQELAGPLGLTQQQVLNLLEHPTSKDYVVLAKGVSAPNQTKIAALNIPGVASLPAYVRDYPDGDATANVVGFTNVNPATGVIAGQTGLEQEYNKLLSGTPGSEQVEIGADGQPIPLAGSKDTPAQNGTGIRLTIIPALQLAAQQACEAEVNKTDARQCTVVIIQPKTGAILAMAQWPTYDQNTLTNVADAKNLAVQDIFAPGSTAKVMTAAAAFERGGQTPMSPYYIPSEIYRGGQWITDAEADGGSHYTIAGIIAHSSNVGMSQVVEHVPPQVQYDYLRAFGLGEPTGLNLPGESPGILPKPDTWAGDERYTLSFGQGVAVNAVQMASVYATIANNGVRVQPTLIAGTYNSSGQYTPASPEPSRRVIQPKTAHELVQILQQVPGLDAEGNAPWAVIPGYAVAAKTGTAQEPGPHCALCQYGSSFIGMAPGNGPQVVVSANVQNPDSNIAYFGANVAGPVLYNAMKFALQTLQIPPQPGLVAPYVRLNAP
ncbi:MAG: penicillin-binding protein 2, partial [Trebonia sp.]|uniref:peptidoglycan D,D-transpeptidase FtsI family protein n=2 Tax=Trebonia sp. TaxID=2767075 RepID=UPI003C707E66